MRIEIMNVYLAIDETDIDDQRNIGVFSSAESAILEISKKYNHMIKIDDLIYQCFIIDDNSKFDEKGYPYNINHAFQNNRKYCERLDLFIEEWEIGKLIL